jgi:pSer/pThr/pTyr-binding forkhead associated (FHA) protein
VVFLLKQGVSAIIGREKNNQVVLPDISVSRRHAEVFPGPDGIYIRDLESSNGVTVNQFKIDNPYRLSNSDRIRIGSIVVYFVDQRSQSVPVAPGAHSSPHSPTSNKWCVALAVRQG